MIKNLFPTQIYQNKLKAKLPLNFNKDLVTEIFQFKKIDKEGQIWSKKNYVKGYTSYGSLAQLHRMSSTFETLEEWIRPHVFKYSQSLEMNIPKKELKVSSLWINIMPFDAAHTMHIHPLSVISGTYYVQTPPNCAALKFEDPRLVNFMASPPRKPKARIENQRFVSLSPSAGSLILFESWLKHEVPPNKSKEDRISVSFNYDWIS